MHGFFRLLAVLLLLPGFDVRSQVTAFSTTSGVITFRSDAPLEIIRAESTKLLGRIDAARRTFAFKVLIRSFQGFNSSLQQIHFNENYLETDHYPEATFAGKIIEPIDFTVPGKYTIRAKGNLKIHGVEQERIIKSELTVLENSVRVESVFTILLSDHNIRIPRVVHEKIATEIKVNVTAELTGE